MVSILSKILYIEICGYNFRQIGAGSRLMKKVGLKYSVSGDEACKKMWPDPTTLIPMIRMGSWISLKYLTNWAFSPSTSFSIFSIFVNILSRISLSDRSESETRNNKKIFIATFMIYRIINLRFYEAYNYDLQAALSYLHEVNSFWS